MHRFTVRRARDSRGRFTGGDDVWMRIGSWEINLSILINVLVVVGFFSMVFWASSEK